VRHNGDVQISAKAEYAVRAMAELAIAPPGPVKGERLAHAQDLPAKFLENILLALRNDGLVVSQRGAEGGYWLAKPAAEISIADVIRAVDGPLAYVRGRRPEEIEYDGAAKQLSDVWIAVRASLRSVLEAVSLADLVNGPLPSVVTSLATGPEARKPH
jgi:Rrf2 family protein